MTTDLKTKELIKRYQISKRESDLNKIFKLNEGFLYGVALKFAGDLESNFQNMKIGMLDAVLSFDFEMKNKFTSYAISRMMGANSKYNTMTSSDKHNANHGNLEYEDGSLIQVADKAVIDDDILANKILLKRVDTYLSKQEGKEYEAFRMYFDSNNDYSIREINFIYNRSSGWLGTHKKRIFSELRHFLNENKRKTLYIL